MEEKISEEKQEEISKELNDDMGSVKKVLNQTKAVKTITKAEDKTSSGKTKIVTVDKRKRILGPTGKEIKSFYGKTLKVEKRLHEKGQTRIIAKPGTKYDEIPAADLVKVSFFDSDFE